jgi:hypothetical protein
MRAAGTSTLITSGVVCRGPHPYAREMDQPTPPGTTGELLTYDNATPEQIREAREQAREKLRRAAEEWTPERRAAFKAQIRHTTSA